MSSYLGIQLGVQWLDERGKSLIVLDPELDLTTRWGRAIAGVLIIFAELEREMIKDRVKSGYDSRRAEGRYSGLQFPFGYEPVPLTFHPDGRAASWGYKPGRYAEVVRKMVDMLVNVQSLGAIVRWLNHEGIPTPRDAVREFYNSPLTGAEWRTQSVVKILQSDAILGAVTSNGESVRGHDALIVMRAELTEIRVVRATDHSEAIAAQASAIGHLSTEIALARVRGDDTSALEATLAERNADLEHLAAKPATSARSEEVKTGETWRQRWERLGEEQERNAFLRSRGVRVVAGENAVIQRGWHPRSQEYAARVNIGE